MSLELKLEEVRKAAKGMKCEKFSGEKKDWPIWSKRFRCSLSQPGADLEHLLDSQVIDTVTKDPEKLTVCKEAARTVWAHLQSSLKDAEFALVVNLAPWSKSQVKAALANVRLTASTLVTVTAERANAGQPSPSAQGSGSSSGEAKDSAFDKHAEELLKWPHPSDAWATLKKKYEPNTAAHVQNLFAQLRDLKMEDDYPTYLARLQSIWNQLEKMNHPISDEQRYVQLRFGLPESAEAASSYMDANEMSLEKALMYLDKYFARDALRREQSNAQTSNALATTVVGTAQVSKKRASGPGRKCWTCNRPGHIAANCPEKGKVQLCTYCTRPGHTEQECRTKMRAASLKKEKEQKEPEANQVIVGDGRTLMALMVTDHEGKTSQFRVDSGTEVSVCNNEDFFTQLSPLPHPLTLKGYNVAAGGELLTQGGTIEVNVIVQGKKCTARIPDVVYAANARANLISTPELLKRGYHDKSTGPRHGKPGGWTLYTANNRPVLQATLVGKKLLLDLDGDGLTSSARTKQEKRKNEQSSATVLNTKTLELIHQELGHAELHKVKEFVAQHGLNVSSTASTEQAIKDCVVCKEGKATRQPYLTATPEENRAKKIGERCASDVWGPARIISRGGNSYYINFVDERSRYELIYFIKYKSDVPEKIKEVVSYLSARNQPMRFLRHDNAREYSTKALTKYLTESGVQVETTAPYSSAQNGLSERVHRTNMDRARCMLAESGLPLNMWAEARRHATDTYNLTPHKALGGKSPYELWNSGKKPDPNELKVFGCAAYVLQEHASKLEPKAKLAVYLGREPDHSCYRLYDPETRKIFSSRNVTFKENEFPLRKKAAPATAAAPKLDPFACHKEPQAQASEKKENRNENQDLIADDDLPKMLDESDDEHAPESPRDGGAQNHDFDQEHDLELEDLDHEEKHSPDAINSLTAPAAAPAAAPPAIASAAPMLAHAPADMPEMEVKATPSSEPAPEAPPPVRHSTRANRGVPSSKHKNDYFIFLTMEGHEPTSYREAIDSDDTADWKVAMQREIDALHKNNTWVLVERPTDRKVLKGKWVYRIKLKEDGTVSKYKARWVVKGFMEVPGLDYDETFAPVPQLKSLRILLALAALKGLKLHQLDVTSAFLNGEIDKEIYVEQPEGYGDGTGRVCLLKKSLYGLKQAPRIWNCDLDQTLAALGLKQCRTDPCVYVQRSDGKLLILLVYVDDTVILYDDANALQSVVHHLQAAYDVQVCGELKWILGQNVTNTADAITVDQSLYVSKLLAKFGMADCTPVATPAVEAAPATENEQQADISAYRSQVGSLLHATNCTRVDLAFATSYVSRFMSNATRQQEVAVKRILRYLKGHPIAALKFNKSENPDLAQVQLIGYSDASWGNDYATARSMSGYVFLINGAPVSWKSKLQPVTALSSTEAEYVALSAAAMEATWIRMFLEELGFAQEEPTTIHIDNQSAIAIAENPIHHARTKHINIKIHHVRDLIQDGTIRLQWCPTGDMVADIFTKPLGRVLFQQHARHLINEPEKQA